MNNLSITKFTKDDIKSVYTVFELSIADAFHKEGIEDCEEDIIIQVEEKKKLINSLLDNKESGLYFLVAKVDDNVIGTISFGPCGDAIKNSTNNELNSIGELGSLYILPDYQDKGVGTALINSMIKYIHGLGIKEFCLDSGYSGAQKRWTRKFGKPYKIAKDYWGEEADNMVWLCRVSDYLK